MKIYFVFNQHQHHLFTAMALWSSNKSEMEIQKYSILKTYQSPKGICWKIVT